MNIEFVAYAKPQPQGSIQSFILPNKEAVDFAANTIANMRPGVNGVRELIVAAVKKTRAILTSDNSNLKAYRKEVTRCAVLALKEASGADGQVAEKHVPVEIAIDFVFERPPSVNKKRFYPVVKPDIDKLERAVLDSLSGHVYADDAQVVTVTKSKRYGPCEGVKVRVWSLYDVGVLPLLGELFPAKKKAVNDDW